MNGPTLEHYLVFSALLFCVGLYGGAEFCGVSSLPVSGRGGRRGVPDFHHRRGGGRGRGGAGDLHCVVSSQTALGRATIRFVEMVRHS